MSRIFFDTNLFIYLFEGHRELSARVASILERMVERGDELITSTLTVGEVLVRPLEAGNSDLVARYETILDSPVCSVMPFDRACARIYARVRADRSIRAPDAIQLACASRAGCDLLITNDDRLSRKNVPGIDFITSLSRAYL